MKRFMTLAVVVALMLGVISVAAAQGPSQSYLVISNGGVSGLDARVAAAGGTVTNVIPEIGLVVAESSNPNFRNSIGGVRAVVPNIMVQMTEPVQNIALDANFGNPPNSGDDDFFFDLQWGHDAVNAPEAWAAGSRGNGALVAVLDGGFSLNHPDIAPNVVGWADMTGEGIEYGPNSDDASGIFSHGMHVAGTIAAADNAFGTIGVAPEASLLLVKVLFNFGSGTFEDVAEGIIYAANFGGVDVINMSLGATIPQGSGIGSNEVAALRVLMNRAISYAYQQGITVITSAGNSAADMDKDKSNIVLPAQTPHAISISATAPIGWATPGWDGFFDNLASYSNYGRSGIDFGAPGGDFVYPGNENCTVAGLVRPCWVLDFVFSTGSTVGGAARYYWSVGTSMASPHAAGIAALIVAENGGSMHPAQVKAEMARRADNIDGNGNSPFYGAGRVASGY